MERGYVKGTMFIHSLSHKESRFVHNKGIALLFTLAWPYTPEKGFAHDLCKCTLEIQVWITPYMSCIFWDSQVYKVGVMGLGSK